MHGDSSTTSEVAHGRRAPSARRPLRSSSSRSPPSSWALRSRSRSSTSSRPTRWRFARLSLSALALGLLWRPDYGRLRHRLPLLGGFGVALAGLNLSLYAAMSHAPLGIAITLAFAGRLG